MGDQEILQDVRATFSQIGYTVDDCSATHSTVGMATIEYVTPPNVQYFNLAVRDGWWVQNMPLIFGELRRRVRQVFYYDLGIANCARVREVSYGLRVTAQPLELGPPMDSHSRVGVVEHNYYSAFSGRRPPAPPVSLEPLVPQVDILACRIGFPNDPCGPQECGPAAAHNCLKWLVQTHGLTVDPQAYDIKTLKKELAWDDGVKHGAWPDKKAAYIANKKLPFTSVKFKAQQIATVYEQFKKGQAVELDLGDHVVSVVCMGQSGQSNPSSWTLNVASDLKQKNDPKDGPTTETITLVGGNCTNGNPNWAKGRDVNNFVVQCPKK